MEKATDFKNQWLSIWWAHQPVNFLQCKVTALSAKSTKVLGKLTGYMTIASSRINTRQSVQALGTPYPSSAKKRQEQPKRPDSGRSDTGQSAASVQSN